MNKIKILVIAGPTASGKTALAIEMAKRVNGEIVSADSMQIYKGMDIATAKPTLTELQQVPHHLIGFLNTNDVFSVALYKDLADNIIADISKRGKIPIVVGGTGLYIDALINNICYFDNSKNPEIRLKLQKRVELEGSQSLYNELITIDPLAAKKIHPNNSLKIIRALEIYYSKGKTLTDQNEKSKLTQSPYNITVVCLFAENRNYLYDRINKRVDSMIENGLIEETKKFYNSNISNTCAQAIGYKELKPYIDGLASLDECIENLKKSTRRYAKRQLTWFRRYNEIKWIPIDKYITINEQAEICQRIF